MSDNVSKKLKAFRQDMSNTSDIDFDSIRKLEIKLPQLHVDGGADKGVPTSVTRSIVAAVGPCAQSRVIDGMSHEVDWGGKSPALLSIVLSCS